MKAGPGNPCKNIINGSLRLPSFSTPNLTSFVHIFVDVIFIKQHQQQKNLKLIIVKTKMADTRSRSTGAKYDSNRRLECMLCGSDRAKYAFVSENPVFLVCENCVTRHISAYNGRPHIIEEVR